MGARVSGLQRTVVAAVEIPLAALIALDAGIVVLFAVGSWRFDPRLSIAPGLSLNQLFLLPALLTVTLAVRGPRTTEASRSLRTGLVLVGLLGISYLWTPAREYGWDKLIHFAGFTLLAWSWVVRSAGRPEGAARLLLIFGGVGIALGLAGVGAFALSGWSGRLAVFGGGPNVFSRWVAIGLLVLAALTMRLGPAWRRVLTPFLLVAASALGLALLLANSKGSLVAALAAAGYLLVRVTPRWSWARRILALVSIVAVVGAVGYALEPEIFARLVLSPMDARSEGSYGARASFLSASVELIRNGSLWGTGVGGWAMEVLATDAKRYPHNLVFEVLSELGPVLGGAFLLALASLLMSAWRAARGPDPVTSAIKSVVVFTTLVVLFSGDLVDSRIFVLALFLLDAARVWSKSADQESEGATSCA